MEKRLSDRANGNYGFNEEKQVRNARKMSLAVGASLPNFDTEAAQNEVFPIKLVNADDADKIIVLHPGLLTSVAQITTVVGVTPDGIAKEGTVITDVTCTTKSGTLMEYLQAHVNKNPTRIIGLQVKSSDEAQLNEDLVFAKISPFKKLSEQRINPASKIKATNPQSKLVNIDLSNIQIDDQTVWYVNLLAGATLQLQLTTGVASNAALVLAKQAEIVYSV